MLGSATPSLESYAAALAGRIGLDRTCAIARRACRYPPYASSICREFEGATAVSSAGADTGDGDRLERGEKRVLFVNRRGSAGVYLCRNCGNVPECTRCSVSLSVHRQRRSAALPLLRPSVADSKRLSELRQRDDPRVRSRHRARGGRSERLFPQARVVRMDLDTTTRVGDHARILDEFEPTATSWSARKWSLKVSTSRP